MKAAFIHAVGSPDAIQYGDLPTPEPKPGEVRVKIHAASINPIDVYIRGGMVPASLPRPFVPGCDFAGVVDALGNGVTKWRIGDRVWGSNQGLGGRQGTLAEYAAMGEQWLYPTPEGVTDIQAAATALVGITAHIGLFHRMPLKSGETLFVNGGTGGVGAMVIQMAKIIGAKVITTVGTADKVAMAKALGADTVINYKTDDVPATIRAATQGKGVDVWFETQPPADFDRTIELMAQRGRIIVMAGRAARPAFPNGAFYVKGLMMIGFAMFNFSAEEQQICANDINHWLASGKLRTPIAREFPLIEAAAAHRLQEENTIGKAGTLAGKIVVVM